MAVREAISIENLSVRATQIWKNEWFLLTAGAMEGGDFNTMTVA